MGQLVHLGSLKETGGVGTEALQRGQNLHGIEDLLRGKP